MIGSHGGEAAPKADLIETRRAEMGVKPEAVPLPYPTTLALGEANAGV
jgi:hypothetical protein